MKAVKKARVISVGSAELVRAAVMPLSDYEDEGIFLETLGGTLIFQIQHL